MQIKFSFFHNIVVYQLHIFCLFKHIINRLKTTESQKRKRNTVLHIGTSRHIQQKQRTQERASSVRYGEGRQRGLTLDGGDYFMTFSTVPSAWCRSWRPVAGEAMH